MDGNDIDILMRQICPPEFSIQWYSHGPQKIHPIFVMFIQQKKFLANRPKIGSMESNSKLLQYEKPKEANLEDLSCDLNISSKLKSPPGESYNFVFDSPTSSFFELELILGN